jgi:diguanylate cyclase (GGDEF)-like protein/PAS domain S-box-containing protein
MRGPAAPDRGTSASEAGNAHQLLLLLRTFEASSQGWFWSIDGDGCLTYISENVACSLSDEPALLLGRSFSDVFALADEDHTGRKTLPFVLSKHASFEKMTLRPAADGDERYWAVSGRPQFDQAGRFIGYLGSAIDITDQRKSSEHASQLAKYDALTGLPNRRRMAELLDAQLAGAEHYRRSCTVMLIDLDRFKQVNDTLGHPAGDALLKQVAERLACLVGERDRVFRLGGDEFQVIIPNCDDRGVIGELASSIVSSLSQPYSVEGSRCVIGASIGVAIAPVDGQSRPELIRNADLALYGSKAAGRGRFSFFSTDLLEAAEDKRTLEEDLRDALARGEMSLAYQPIVDAKSNQIAGVEALLRWTHPTRGAISPALFVPIAEEAGLVGHLGDWALRKACEDAATWPGKLRVAVNVSPVQFNGEALPATVTSALAASGLSPDRLELEITEGVFLGDTRAADAMFAALKGIGVRLALDDFGTGYSSLGYLRTAPFDKIKIDQTFVREATLPGSRNGAIIAAIVALAEALDMDTTAEGIEYMDQLDLIRSLRVSHVQGWVYGKAIPSDELALRLNDGNWTIAPSGPATQRSGRQAVYRKVGLILGRRYQSAIMRNLSATGALIEGAQHLPPRSLLVVDFGDGQMTFARAVRASGRQVGIEFEQELVDDGNGGLCTRHRVSPYTLATAGLPNPGDPDKDISDEDEPVALEALARRLGLTLATRPQRASPLMSLRWASAHGSPATFGDISERYLESLFGDEEARESARRDLERHILPQFGQLRLDQVGESDMSGWLASKGGANEPTGDEDSKRLRKLLARMCELAVDLRLAEAGWNPLAGSLRVDRRGQGEKLLSEAEVRELLLTARGSQNRQLKYIISLLMLTGARTGEILNVRWDHIDLLAGVWRVHVAGTDSARELRMSQPAVKLLRALPRFPDCCHVVPNPATRKPYRSLTQSWDVVKAKAVLPHLELDDLRYCDLGADVWEERLLNLLQGDEDS